MTARSGSGGTPAMGAGARWPRAAAAVLLAAAALFWAGNFVLGRGASGVVPPVGLALWRWVAAGLILLPFVARPVWAARGAILRHAGLFAALGLLGVGSFNALAYLALTRTEAINGALANSLVPAAILAAALLLDGERPAGRQVAGLAVSLAGVVVVVARGDPHALAALRVNWGDLVMLAAVLAWALYTVLLRRVPAPLRSSLGPLGLLAVTVLAGLPLLALCRLAERALGGLPMPSDAASLALVAYTALFASIAAYLCWNGGVALIGPAAAGPFIHLMPIFAALLAVPLLGEAVRPFHALGLLLIVSGVALAGRR
jgi:drug/metabolite transporter (DMT)-like permease